MSGSASQVTVAAIPTGGSVLLSMPGYLQPPPGVTYMVLSRASGSSSFVPFYSGAPCPFYVDCGDGTPGPLLPNVSYQWLVADSTGSTVAGPLMPVGEIVTTPDALTQMLIRLLQGAVNSLTLPQGINLPQITIKFPQNGWQALPLIVVNLDLIQQSEVQIGEDVVNPVLPSLDWTIWVNAKRVWRVSVLSKDAAERDFYRDSLLMIFRVLKATAFTPIGYNVSHSFQANSYTDVAEFEGKIPGFYGADLMLEINGIFNTAVLTNYGIIKQFSVATTIDDVVFSDTEKLQQG